MLRGSKKKKGVLSPAGFYNADQHHGSSGGNARRYQITSLVHSVTFTIADKRWIPEKIMVEWKRNARIATTKLIKYDASKYLIGTVVTIPFEEPLSMVSNFTEVSPDKFEGKDFKFSIEDVREKKSKKQLANGLLDLSEYIKRPVERKVFSMIVNSTKISQASIVMSISCNLVGAGQADDAMSVYSTASIQSSDLKALQSSGEEDEDDEDKVNPEEQRQKLRDLDLLISGSEENATNPFAVEEDLVELEKKQPQQQQNEEEVPKSSSKTKKSLSKKKAVESESETKSLEHGKEVAELTAKIALLTQQLNEKDAERKSLVDAEARKVADVQKNAEMTTEQLQKKHASEIEKLNRIIEKKDSQIDEYKKTLESSVNNSELDDKAAAAKIGLLEVSIDSLRKDKEEVEVQLTELQGERDELLEEVKAKEEELDSLEKVNEDLQTEKEHLIERVSSLEEVAENNKQLQNENERLHKRIVTLESSAQEYQKVIASLKEQQGENAAGAQDLEKEMESLRSELEKSQYQVQLLQAQLDVAKESEEQRQSDNNDNSEEPDVAEIRAELQKVQAELRVQNIRYGVTEKDLVNTKEELAKVSADHKKLEKELDETIQQLIIVKMTIAEDQYTMETLKLAKKEAEKKLALEKLKAVELKKKLTEFEVQAASSGDRKSVV